ncbi:hypothetical protein HPB50_029486 [Hyalomma asiaticum]|nr:hypothetical protein HPB50_029486 [Hyalomma asiaticum]
MKSRSLSEEGGVLVLDNMGATSAWENVALRVSLYCLGCGAVYVLGIAIAGGTYASAVGLNRVLAEVRGTDRSPPPKKQPWSPHVFLLVAGLLLLIVATCAAVAMFVGSLVFAVRVPACVPVCTPVGSGAATGPSSEGRVAGGAAVPATLWLWVAAWAARGQSVVLGGTPVSAARWDRPLAPTATFLILAKAVLWQPFIPNPQG